MPQAESLARRYQDDEYASVTHGQEGLDALRVKSAPYYERISRVLLDNGIRGRVLDYGAGWGGLVETLKAAGLDAQGVELSQSMVDDAQRRKLPLRRGDLSAVEGERFDAITMCGVFEHLTDPRAFLAEARHRLVEGGLVVSLQPTAPFAHVLARFGRRDGTLPGAFFVFDAPWHVALYSIAGMKMLADAAGFDVIAVQPAPQGHWGGALGAVQRLASAVNRVGWALAGAAWPLLVAHIFVFRRRPTAAAA